MSVRSNAGRPLRLQKLHETTRHHALAAYDMLPGDVRAALREVAFDYSPEWVLDKLDEGYTPAFIANRLRLQSAVEWQRIEWSL